MARSLIITADDLGIDAERNRGILEAHQRGVVTSVSVLANGPALEDAVARLKAAPSLATGIHVNVTEGKPLAEGHSTIVGPDGSLLGKEALRSIVEQGGWRSKIDPAELFREAVAQVKRLRALGLKIAHLDGHQHMHVYPVVRDQIARAAGSFCLPTARLPEESAADGEETGEGDGEAERARVAGYAKYAAESRPVYERYGVRSPARFAGLRLTGRFTKESFLGLLSRLPEGWTEVITHPGYPSPGGSPFSTADREAELRVLADPEVVAFVKGNFRLGTYADALKP